MNRPSWDEYYMDMAFYISQRSIDPSTKHGCMVVNAEHIPLSMGYNSPPRGCIDEDIPLTRPEKYPFMVHAEENAIINAAYSGTTLKGSTFYITGFPCSRCFRGILNVGATRIVYGPVNSKCVSEEDLNAIKTMNQKWGNYHELLRLGYTIASDEKGYHLPKVKIPKIEFFEYKGSVGKILSQAQDYIKQKCSDSV